MEELKLAEVETSELRENVKQLKLQVKKLEELVITSKSEEPSCPYQEKGKKVHPRSKMILTTSTKDPKLSCLELGKEGHFANGIYLVVSDPTEPKNIQAISCEFAAADKSNL